MTRRICITGPEATGKSSLAESLAQKFDCPWVPEYARTYLNQLDRPYKESDLREILIGQLNQEKSLFDPSRPFLFADTGPEVIWVWSHFKYGRVSDEIIKITSNHTYDHTLLLDIDLPWTPDPLRENPSKEERTELLTLYRSQLQKLGRNFTVISGCGDDREKTAIAAIGESTG